MSASLAEKHIKSQKYILAKTTLTIGSTMTKLEAFLKNLEEIKTKAKNEINSRDTRAEVTALRAKYLGKKTGILGRTLVSFNPSSDNEKSLSRHAIKKASQEIDKVVTTKIIEITKAEND